MTPAWRSLRFWVFTLLAIAFVARLALVWHGGQYFFPDETRYDRGVLLYQSLLAGDFAKARGIALLPEHMLFTWITAALSAGHHLLAQLTAYGDWSRDAENASRTIGIGASLLAMFSTLNLALTHWLARALGASAIEAAWALLLMATANTAFYYARHLLPYDCALSFALLALIAGCGGPARWRSLACGALAGLAYGVYNGFWYLAPVIWLTHAFAHRHEPRPVPRSLLCGAGLALGLALPPVFGSIVDARYYWSIVREFSNSVRQGAMSEGWSLPWAHFWHAEGALGAAVVAAILIAVVLARRHRTPLAPVAGVALFALAGSYALLVLTSNGLGVFTVYGRTVKPFVPLLCLAGGWALARLLAGRPRFALLAVAVLILAGAARFAPHFTRLFPADVVTAVRTLWGNPKRTVSIPGTLYIEVATPVTRPDLVLVNAQILFPARASHGYPAGTTLAHFEHPLAFKPYQYEGYDPQERAVLRTHDISMRLILLTDPASVPLPAPAAR